MTILWATLNALAADPSFDAVQFKTRDGIPLHAFFSEPQAGQPTVIMLHGLAAQKEEWLPLAQELRAAGLGVLAYDARGHGASSRSKNKDGSPNEYQHWGPPGPRSTWERMIDDVGTAVAFLQEQKVDRDSIVLAGASLGANVALNYAVLARPVRGLVLLSPGLNYAEIKTEEVIGKVSQPVLIVASEADPYSFSSSKTLKKKARNAALWTNVKAGHGAQMFDAALLKRLVQWIKTAS